MAADAGAERSKALRHTTSCECCLLGVMRVRTHDHPQRPTCVTHTRTHTRELASIRKHTRTHNPSLSLSLYPLTHYKHLHSLHKKMQLSKSMPDELSKECQTDRDVDGQCGEFGR